MSIDAAKRHELEVRAAAGSLTFDDRRMIRHAIALRDGMARGGTVALIAVELGDISRSALSRFLGSQKYHAALSAATIVPEERKLSEEAAVEAARQAVANALPEAVEFITHAFARDETKPTRPYLDEGLAQWATALLLKASGIGDPNNAAAKPPVVITAEAMQVMLGAIRGDDAQRERLALPLPSVTVSVTANELH